MGAIEIIRDILGAFSISLTFCADEICPIWKVKFAKVICLSPYAICHKKLIILFAKKSRTNMLVKSTPVVPNRHLHQDNR